MGVCTRQAPRSSAIGNQQGMRKAMQRAALLVAHLSGPPPEMAGTARMGPCLRLLPSEARPVQATAWTHLGCAPLLLYEGQPSN